MEEDRPAPHSRLQSVLEYNDPWRSDWRNGACTAVGRGASFSCGAVVGLGPRAASLACGAFTRLAPSYILSLSIGAALLLNLVATSAAYVFGVVAWWVWMG
jgi:hypothetical protein